MPLRDHFRPPVWNQASWEGFHGGWPMMMVLNLAPKLPKGFAAEPRVHLGTYFEIDVCTFDKNGERDRHFDPVTSGGVATAALAPPAPTLTVDVDFQGGRGSGGPIAALLSGGSTRPSHVNGRGAPRILT